VYRRLSPQELAHQEALIAEREREIRNIEEGIHELSGLVGQIGSILTEQTPMLGLST